MFVEPTADEIAAYRSYTGLGLNEARHEVRATRLKEAIPEARTLSELSTMVGLMADMLL